MINICSIRRPFYVFNIILLSAAPMFSQSKTCDLKLEVILSPEPGSIREIPVMDAIASYFDSSKLKAVSASLKDGMPYFAKLTEGRYRVSVTKTGHKTTTKRVSIECALADSNGAISEIIFLWKGRSKEVEDMSADLESSGGEVIEKPKARFPDAGRGASGVVEVRITVDERGKVIDAWAVSGATVFAEAAMDAARRIKFTPKIVQGQRVRFTKNVAYTFNTYTDR